MDSEMKTPRVISIPLSRDCLIKISFVSMEELRHKLEKEKKSYVMLITIE